MSDLKRCRTCGNLKQLEDFHRKADRSDGRASICRACDRERARAYYQQNRAACIERARAYYADNRSERQAWQRDYYRKRKELAMTQTEHIADDSRDALAFVVAAIRGDQVGAGVILANGNATELARHLTAMLLAHLHASDVDPLEYLTHIREELARVGDEAVNRLADPE